MHVPRWTQRKRVRNGIANNAKNVTLSVINVFPHCPLPSLITDPLLLNLLGLRAIRIFLETATKVGATILALQALNLSLILTVRLVQTLTTFIAFLMLNTQI